VVKRILFTASAALALTWLAAVAAAQQAARVHRPAEPLHDRQREVGWRLAPSEQPYGSIDGEQL